MRLFRRTVVMEVMEAVMLDTEDAVPLADAVVTAVAVEETTVVCDFDCSRSERFIPYGSLDFFIPCLLSHLLII